MGNAERLPVGVLSFREVITFNAAGEGISLSLDNAGINTDSYSIFTKVFLNEYEKTFYEYTFML